jgi:hypothetical protein
MLLAPTAVQNPRDDAHYIAFKVDKMLSGLASERAFAQVTRGSAMLTD